ncbi:hypothetical protein [Roseofilum casamattae]|uniref:Uncharacterized protein n=1 Tax=Roseofilum casamattae BLCC-M143 TaxID=3022442 RepID=A0ABT7C396_9CYAN|nr:hypothetical protein [Roseofilum casamattae]MDJ1185921.1 hypothetical protein [Roseofilum casamattae BLCC-M143]
MTEFTLRLKIPNAGNREIYYSIDLRGTDINHPEDYFSLKNDRGKANRRNMRQAIENELLRQVSDRQLDRIITDWNYGIKHGKSNSTTVTISLEAYGTDRNSVTNAPNYPNTRPSMQQSAPPRKAPNSNRSQGIPRPKTPTQPPSGQNPNPTTQPNLDKDSPTDDVQDTPSPPETWATDNKADF